MLTPPPRLYPHDPESILVLYDLRNPEACEHLHQQRAIWQERSDIEALDQDHFVLTIKPGSAIREAA